MSSGQQQVLAIGRALMSRPRLVILDEISLGLAPVIMDRQSLADYRSSRQCAKSDRIARAAISPLASPNDHFSTIPASHRRYARRVMGKALL